VFREVKVKILKNIKFICVIIVPSFTMAEVKRGAGRGILRFASQSVCISL